MAADFGRIETCGCCGKSVKQPVFSKRLNSLLGKDCAGAIAAVRVTMIMEGEARAAERARRDWPRTWERLLELAR